MKLQERSSNIRPEKEIIYVITVTYNPLKDAYFEQFLNCLNNQNVNFHTIIIDNNSQDGTVERLKSLSASNLDVILNSSNIGFAAACNQGIDIAMQNRAEYIVFLNNDTVFAPDFFSELFAAMIDSGADAMSPLISFYPDTTAIWYAGGHFRRIAAFTPIHDHYGQSTSMIKPLSRNVSFASGCCLIVRRSLIEAIGGFDQSYFVYWEDADFCLRARKKGFKIFFSNVPKLHHLGSVSTGGPNSNFSIYQYHKNHMIFLRKHFGKTFTAASLVFIFCKMMLKFVLGRADASACRIQLAAMRDGLALDLSILHK